jgi:hypothetical protein
MKLQLITDQGGSFDGYYADCTSQEVHPSWIEPIRRTRELLDYLEQNVEGPPQWVTITHLIYFYLSEVDDWRPEKAQVFVDPMRDGFKIKYRSAREIHYWNSFTTLEAHDVAEAGRMIAEALQRAERNLPGRGD